MRPSRRGVSESLVIFGKPDGDADAVWGQHQPPHVANADGLIVGGFPKLYALAKSSPAQIAALGDRAGLLVIDEAHQAIAPTYELIIQGLAARRVDMPVLGLTATPGRT